MFKVIILHRPYATSGGDWVALQGYAAGLERQGVKVELRPAHLLDDLDADYVHLWAACAPDWGLPAARAAKQQGQRLIITPFWWSREERQAFYGKPGRDLTPTYTRDVTKTLRLADVLFTVTTSEAEQCHQLAPDVPAHVVPMGFDEPPVVAQEPEDYALCIGRIEPHKNQMGLAVACNMLRYELRLVGKVESKNYLDMCLSKCRNLTVYGELDEGDKRLLLSHARVHALPSFFENPGLVHGEALSMGVPAVMGNRGCEPEFYGDAGIYCNPTDLGDIMSALQKAWEIRRITPPVGLPTWDDAAKKALDWMVK